ncbi:hypothetical protein PHMEG_0004345 [Phytophthora megakarya]|uniref:Uncharacterized protein n=1 Tax=Phytophthora megakarya TaxID=4795 RepID=A0A225WU57_9STRA|nr:hypothetical protein PHMEG_0004345 [Phytophthora megakarya]
MDNHQQQRAAPARQFSTRFLPSDGIPEYNALLDTHLGKRREFLLGNRHALELMQQTGVIDRVETQPENPNQYVVHIAEKHIHRRKRLPPRSASGPLQLPESQTMPWRQQSGAHGFLAKHTDAGRKNTTNQFLDIDGSCNDVDAAKREKAAMLRGLSRSVSSNTVLATSCKPVLKSASANRLALFGSTKCNALLEASVVKGTVEHLLESDAAFMTQIRTMKEQLAQLEKAKAYLDSEIGLLRRKLRGVNAVHENDVAVAHCSSIMQHRLSKAEEEFMKLVTQQQEMKKDVDRVRRELLSLRKVRHKLQEDIEEVAQANQTYEEKIYASKTVRNQLSEELSELERSAEVELEEQRLNLPPEDAVVVDVAKLMGAVQERNSARHRPKKLDYCVRYTAFHVLQNSLGFSDLETFEEQFTTTEEQLLSKYKANLALADEVAALEKELFTMYTEKKINRENARGIMQANESMQRAMQVKVQATQASIRSYNDLREQRNQEHAKLRAIMVRCLDALQIDVGPETNGIGMNGNRTPGSRRSSTRNWAEASSPELLETLQRKMTHVAVTLKVKHSARIHEIPPEALRLNRGHDGRRSNMFSARETSKIVLGPREPSGSALAAILEREYDGSDAWIASSCQSCSQKSEFVVDHSAGNG